LGQDRPPPARRARVTDLDSLRDAAEQGRIQELKGLGAKVEERVLAELETLPTPVRSRPPHSLQGTFRSARELAEALRRPSCLGACCR